MTQTRQTTPTWTGTDTSSGPPAHGASPDRLRPVAANLRRHQQEILVLAGTVLFVLVVALISLRALL